MTECCMNCKRSVQSRKECSPGCKYECFIAPVGLLLVHISKLQDQLQASAEERAQLLEERAQLLEMVSKGTAALSATASRCDELKQQHQELAQQLQSLQDERRRRQQGLCAAAAATASTKRAVVELQEAVPGVFLQAHRQFEVDVYKLVAAVTQSMGCKDRQQNTELFNRVMQVLASQCFCSCSHFFICSANRRCCRPAVRGMMLCQGAIKALLAPASDNSCSTTL
jgi:hypothetical protein